MAGEFGILSVVKKYMQHTFFTVEENETCKLLLKETKLLYMYFLTFGFWFRNTPGEESISDEVHGDNSQTEVVAAAWDASSPPNVPATSLPPTVAANTSGLTAKAASSRFLRTLGNGGGVNNGGRRKNGRSSRVSDVTSGQNGGSFKRVYCHAASCQQQKGGNGSIDSVSFLRQSDPCHRNGGGENGNGRQQNGASDGAGAQLCYAGDPEEHREEGHWAGLKECNTLDEK